MATTAWYGLRIIGAPSLMSYYTGQLIFMGIELKHATKEQEG